MTKPCYYKAVVKGGEYPKTLTKTQKKKASKLARKLGVKVHFRRVEKL